MKVKIITAESMQEAMSQVKSELGIDAVILHTRRFKKGGILGYLGKEMVEVTAAVEDKPVIKPKTAKIPDGLVPKSIVKQYANAGNGVPANAILAGNEKYKEKNVKALPEKVQAQFGMSEEKGKTENDLQKNEKVEKVNSEKTEENLLNKKDEKIEQLQRELDDMKKMLDQVINTAPQNKMETVSLFTALTENEVDEKFAGEIVAEILDEAVLKDKDQPEAEDFLAEYFERVFRQAKEIEISQEKSKVVALIGTTGVGKTTTIAKLAANFVLEKACSVALITADTYRISAVEQLKTYSDIIGVPIEIVYTPDELKNAIEKHSDKQLILIDTAGRSQHNKFQLDELKAFLSVDHEIEKHLVLSATIKYKDASDILRKFSICEPDKILFTKVDETSSVGSIINLCYQYPITLSYITTGQSVPDDIVLADSHQLAKLILR